MNNSLISAKLSVLNLIQFSNNNNVNKVIVNGATRHLPDGSHTSWHPQYDGEL